nr:hypothetical protein [Bradyrhizobium jicamae]
MQSGCVIRYPFLWGRESDHGETEGRKSRPVAVGVRLARPRGEDVLLLFPITSQAPSAERFAMEIPEMEKRRAGLDVMLRLWIILDEFIQDIVGQSFYLEPGPPLGRFSKAFFLPLMKKFIARRADARGINRQR